MKQKKVESVLVQGYFGQSNLGDDILNIVGLELCKTYFPNAKIYVYSIPKSKYIHQFSNDITLVNSTYGRHFDLIFHSGGGVFFDFKKGNFLRQFANKCTDVFGQKLSRKMHDFYLRVIRRTRFESSDNRIGAGIGVGTFENGSSKLFLAKRRLSEMDKLFVRDSTSIRNLGKINVDIEVEVASDLAFCSQYWLDQSIDIEFKKENQIGVVIRDWGSESSNLKTIETILSIKSQGFHLKFYSFNPSSDQLTLKLLKNKACTVIEWDPNQLSTDEFMRDISMNRLLISSRAHGAIIGSILNVPAIIIEIEPKLKTIHQMLIKSSVLLSENFSESELNVAIEIIMNRDKQLIEDDLMIQSEKNNVIFEYLRALANE